MKLSIRQRAALEELERADNGAYGPMRIESANTARSLELRKLIVHKFREVKFRMKRNKFNERRLVWSGDFYAITSKGRKALTP